MSRLSYLLLFAIAACLPAIHYFNVLHDSIYDNLDVKAICFRRLNGTHAVGCQSNENGNVGVVHLVESDEDVEWILLNKHSFPIVAVLAFRQITPYILMKFKSTNSVVGVLLFEKESKSSLESDFDCSQQCHNVDGRYEDSKCWWNSEKLVFSEFNFPIFIITNDTQINALIQCFKNYGRKTTSDTLFSSFCGIELSARMFASTDTTSCIRKNKLNEQSFITSLVRVTTKIPTFCKPLRSLNGFGTLFETSRHVELKNRSIIVVTSQMDSLSLFDDFISPERSVINSLTVFLSVVKTLSALREEMRTMASDSNILFALLEGEEFDYIGSHRTASDMINFIGLKPMDTFRFRSMKPAVQRLHHWSHFFELKRLVSYHNLWIHSTSRGTSKERKPFRNLVDILKSMSEKLNISITTTANYLPACSANSFLKHDSEISATVLTNYENCYKNTYKNTYRLRKSEFNESIEQLTKLTALTSKSLYKMITNKDKDITVDKTVVQLLLECFLKNSSCQLFKEVNCISDHLLREGKPFPLYTSVSTFVWHQIFVQCIHDVFAYFIATEFLYINESECRHLRAKEGPFTYDWMRGAELHGVCVKSTRFTTEAVSPAFTGEIQNLTSTEYSTWTESVWQTPKARLFLISSNTQQWTTFIFGVLITLISQIFIHRFKSLNWQILNENSNEMPVK